jgi:uncharacterized membrane protein
LPLASTLPLIQLLAIAWLPGAIIFRMPYAARDRRAALPAEERCFWAVVISVAISLSIVLMLASIGRYTFERLLIGDLVTAAVAAAISRFRLRLGALAPRPGLTALIPLALLLCGGWRFFPSSEYIIGGKDPGTYVAEGIQIAQRGAIVVPDPVVASVPNFARPLFFRTHELFGSEGSDGSEGAYGLRFMGFFIRNQDGGEVVGQFPHLLPASIAIGYGLDGLSGARRTVGMWAILGLLAVYFTGARAFGRITAAAAAGLLALNVIEVWFARYPNAEVVLQALLFAAILACDRAHVDDDDFFAPIAGGLLGMLLFLRFDAVLGIAGVLAGLALSVAAGRRVRAGFVIVLALTMVPAALYLLGPMRAYADLPIVFLSHLSWWQYAAIGFAAIVATAAVLMGSKGAVMAAPLIKAVPWILSTVVVAAALYAAFFREPGGRLAGYDAYALRTFAGFYLTLPALLAALLGYAIAARYFFWRTPALFVTIAVFSFFVFYKIRIVPEHFWMARRFLPVILPGTLLFVAAAAFAGTQNGRRGVRLLRGGVGAVLLILLAWRYERASQPILHHVEYAGVIPKLEQLASTIHDGDLLIVESREASDVHTLAMPLAYIYSRNVLVLASRVPDKSLFALFLDWAHGRYRRILFIGGGGTDLLSSRWGVTALDSVRFQVTEYEAQQNAYPSGPRQKEFDYSVYEFVAPSPEGAQSPFDLDVGFRDDLHVLRFHAKETTEGRTFRWSRDTSYISVNRFQPSNRQVILWMSDGGRPTSAPPAEVTVYVGNERLGSVRVGSGFKPYELAIPPTLATGNSTEPVQLKLITTVWHPARLLRTNDDRDLGVMVDRVAVR